jgi:O-acetyl-ADP-ribose deacetylase (regulator of RNase III)
MLTYLYNSLFESPAQTLVNTVNTVGVMGKGIAKRFKDEFPAMFREYKKLCDSGELSIGRLHLWKGGQNWILNFPTKTTWRRPSSLEYIAAGLETFRSAYKELGITSVAFPPLGCGNGELDWRRVKPVMESYLDNLEIPVYIHNMHFGPEFVPEHREPIVEKPEDFQRFLADIWGVMYRRGGQFQTIDSQIDFTASMGDNYDIRITSSRFKRTIPSEELERAWIGLRDGILSIDQYADEASRKYKAYLFGILASLPYVRRTRMQKPGKSTSASTGLFFDRRAQAELQTAEAKQPEQEWLFR